MACLHEAIVAAIGRATDRCDRSHVCLHGAIVAAIGRGIDYRPPRLIAVTIAPCKHTCDRRGDHLYLVLWQKGKGKGFPILDTQRWAPS